MEIRIQLSVLRSFRTIWRHYGIKFHKVCFYTLNMIGVPILGIIAWKLSKIWQYFTSLACGIVWTVGYHDNHGEQ